MLSDPNGQCPVCGLAPCLSCGDTPTWNPRKPAWEQKPTSPPRNRKGGGNSGKGKTPGNVNTFTPPEGTIALAYVSNEIFEGHFFYAKGNAPTMDMKGVSADGSAGIAKGKLKLGSSWIALTGVEASASLSTTALGADVSAVKLDVGITLFHTETHNIVLTGEVGAGIVGAVKFDIGSEISYKLPAGDGLYSGYGIKWVPR